MTTARFSSPARRGSRHAAWVAAALLTLAGLSGCSDDDRGVDPDPAATPTGSASPGSGSSEEEDDMTDPSDSGSPSAPSTVVDEAIADLTERAGVPAEEIEVVSQEEVTWSDGSLGCAQKGMSYTQALVDGFRVVLRADGVDYEYHSAGSETPAYCAEPTQ